MRIVGTAGHVDHGKSRLIEALTGTNPDRLKEEIAREMTIELGFASLKLPDGLMIGIIDVPGHRDFIANMLSGIGSIDAVLLNIAADEGVSAQTREHLAILNLLEIKKGILVLTKTDLVDDPEWLDLVEMDVRELVAATSLAEAPIVRVSAVNGFGIDELKSELSKIIADIPPKKDLGRPRLPVDRVFTLSGFGTVVTGTLLDGSFALGEEIICLPDQKKGRIRGLQNHKQKLQRVSPGFRVAVNLNGLNKEDISRGNVIAHINDYKPTLWLDARFKLLPDVPKPLLHNKEVAIFMGASETVARIRVLGVEQIRPGDSAFVQFKLNQPVVAARGDHFIIRLPSPSITLGGGIVLDPHPIRAYKRFDKSVIARLDCLTNAGEVDIFLQTLHQSGISSQFDLIQKSGLSETEVNNLITDLYSSGQLTQLRQSSDPKKSFYAATPDWDKIAQSVADLLTNYHRNYPLKAGVPREELRGKLKYSLELFALILDKLSNSGKIVQKGTQVWSAEHVVRLNPEQESSVNPLMKKFEQSPFSPPDITETIETIGPDLMEGLLSSGLLIKLSDQVLLSPSAFQEMKNWVEKTIKTNGSLTLAELRDHFSTSRKYAAAILEYLDSIGFTIRKGDIRVLR